MNRSGQKAALACSRRSRIGGKRLLARVATALVRELGLVGIDVRKLKPVQLVQLLNSTPLGEVVDERRLRQHRTRAGLRITSPADPRSVDLLRYVAWLVLERHDPRRKYEAHKESARERQAGLSKSGRDIGEIPPVVDPQRRQACERNLRFYMETYFAKTFYLPWSEDHLKVIAKYERAVLQGELSCVAMPRGSGKTSLAEVACLWAVKYGHVLFVVVIGPDAGHAVERIENLRTELENNDLLLDDFPEVVYPIRKLEGITQRRLLYRNEVIRMELTAKRIVLPNIPGSAAAGAVIVATGITGQIRGLQYKRDDGTVVRPSLVFVDDPQTDESARSPSQCAARERLLAGAVLGLAGPGCKMAGLMTLTVACAGDLADRMLNRDKHPEWQGERTKMVYAFPANEALWKRYAEILREELKAERGIAAATEFYRQHRQAMDEGAVVAWAARHEPNELSAIQNAMNLKIRDEAAFWAEYQNEPLPEEQVDDDLLTADQIAAKVNGLKRGEVPIGCTHLTMFVDVQAKALFWLVAAWEDDFTGYVIDYGTEPEQWGVSASGRQTYFTLRDIRRTLATAAPRAGLEGAIYAGLERLTEARVGKEWRRDDGAMVRIDRCLIDANWGSSSDVVYQFCRQSQFAGVVMPSHGRYVGASSIPFSEYRRKRGDRVGLNWRIPVVTGKRAVRHVVFDTNYWKSFVHARLAVPMGDPGCLSLFGRTGRAGGSPADQPWTRGAAPPHLNAKHSPCVQGQHRLLAEHLTSEYRVKTEGRGRTVDEWKLRLAGLDNHWLDCLVGSAVAASVQGAILFGTDAKPVAKPRIRLSALQGARR